MASIVVTFTLYPEIHCGKKAIPISPIKKKRHQPQAPADWSNKPPGHKCRHALGLLPAFHDLDHMCSLFGLEKGDTFCVPKQLKQAPERQAYKAAAAGAGDALPTLSSDVKRQGQWPVIFRFYFHLQFFTLTPAYQRNWYNDVSDILRLWCCLLWTQIVLNTKCTKTFHTRA